MASSSADQAPSDVSSCPFPRGSLVLFPASQHGKMLGEVFMHLSSDVRFLRASSNPQHADAFMNSDVVVELRRLASGTEESDNDTASVGDTRLSEAIACSALSMVSPRHVHDDCALFISGNIAVREQGCDGEPGNGRLRPVRPGSVLLIASSPEQRDVWLLLLRARVAPSQLWHAVCSNQAPTYRSRPSHRLISFCRTRSTQMSQLEIMDELLELRNRWIDGHRRASGQTNRSYGEESEDDVSDAALLLHASVMQLLGLCGRLAAATSIDTFRQWHDSAMTLRSMAANGRLVSTAALAVVSAARTGDCSVSVGSVLDAVIDSWDALLGVEQTLRDIAFMDTISDAQKISLEAVKQKLRDHALSAGHEQQHLPFRVDDQSPGSASAFTAQDGPYEALFRVDVACSTVATEEGSAQFARVVDEVLNADSQGSVQPVAVTSVSGEGGAGKTTTCVLALRDPRVSDKYKDGVFGFEIGVGAQEEDIIKKIARYVRECRGFATANSISGLKDIGDAVDEARRFFHNKRILLYLDNVWPNSRGLDDLMSIASGRGSCVLFTTRSATLAAGYTDRVVELGTLRLHVEEERSVALNIFNKHLGQQRDHRWCTNANVNEALLRSQGLPIAIATVAALVRTKLERKITRNVLGQVAKDVLHPPRTSSGKLKHKGLYEAMTESLKFLDEHYTPVDNVTGGSLRLMTRRYASLHALERSKNIVNTFILSCLWDTSTDDAEATAGEFSSLGLVGLSDRNAVSPLVDSEDSDTATLTLHDLQAEYSAQLADSGRHGITIEQIHETAVRGIFASNVDIDSLSTDDFVSRCEELYENEEKREAIGGRYLVSNLVRHLIGSLTAENANRRWPTIRQLLCDTRLLFLWQRVDGWSYVCNKYAMLAEELSGKGALDLLPVQEVDILSEIGRVARDVASREWSVPKGEETKEAAADLFRRVHAIWRALDEDAGMGLLYFMLRNLYAMAGEWWLRPMSACHARAARHDGMVTHARISRVRGCALVGGDGHIVVSDRDGQVRLFDRNGALVSRHNAHSERANAVCVGRGLSEAEQRVFSVSDDGTLALWDVTLPHSATGHARVADPIVIDTVRRKLWTVSCSADGHVVAAGGPARVYLWVLNDDGARNNYSRRTLANEHTDRVYCVAVSSDGTKALSGSEDRTCRIWRVADAMPDGPRAQSRTVLKQPTYGYMRDEEVKNEHARSCTFADEGRVAVIGYRGGAVKIWRLDQETPPIEIQLGERPLWSLATIGQAGREVVVGTSTGVAHVVRVSDGAVTAEIGRADFDAVLAVSTPRSDSRVVACAHGSGRVEVWNLDQLMAESEADASTSARAKRPQRRSAVVSVSSSPCGRVVASGHEDHTVRCWSGRSGRCLGEGELESPVICVCVSADAAHIACGCEDGTVLVLDARTVNVVRRWKHSRITQSVSLWKWTDKLVWSGHGNGEVLVWAIQEDLPIYFVRTEMNSSVRDLSVGPAGLSAYARNRRGRISRLDIVAGRVETVTVILGGCEPRDREPNGVLYAEMTASGFRTAGHRRLFARVRHSSRGESYDLSVAQVQHYSNLNVTLMTSNPARTIRYSAGFETSARAVDATVSLGGDNRCGFAQVVCGLTDGRVCILRQPLLPESQPYNSAASWEQFVSYGRDGSQGSDENGGSSVADPDGEGEGLLRVYQGDDHSSVPPSPSGCLPCFPPILSSFCHKRGLQ